MDAFVNLTDIMKILEEDEGTVISAQCASVEVLDYILALKEKIRARLGATGDRTWSKGN